MTEWLGYSLADFVPVSHITYVRLFERYDGRHWPAVLFGVAVGFSALWLLLRRSNRATGVVLAACGCCWIWIAWAFHWQSYAPLNWAAVYFAAAFAIQGVLLIAFGLGTARQRLRVGSDWAAWFGYGLVAIALIAIPLLALSIGGRTWPGLELFGSAPDPTAIATLGLAAAARQRFAWLLVVIPACWCLVSTATLVVIADPLWPLPLVSTLAGILIMALRLPGQRNDGAV
ncbi:MAG: DUF6064 family protein [Thiohalocapsa sp.]